MHLALGKADCKTHTTPSFKARAGADAPLQCNPWRVKYRGDGPPPDVLELALDTFRDRHAGAQTGLQGPSVVH
jgi:hypothetical protein